MLPAFGRSCDAGCRSAPPSWRSTTSPWTPGAHRVTRGGAEIDLTTREIAILEYLLRHQGMVISKAELLEHVWDYNFEGDDNIVEVYMRRLRNKLDRPFGRSSIETVRGAGYRLVAHGR